MPDLNPTQNLIIEVLVARHRLGDHLWAFSTRYKKSLEGLEAAGLIETMHGIVEHTLRARLTPHGIELYVVGNYKPDGFRKYANTIADKLDELGFEKSVGKVIRKQFGERR